eukprot:TRINITY_DN14896_c0_g1_i2.p1 TRINITY_DN14896_c0_g1~~TRINITY_DN14896_c0_g1_i2.p1  ORF type:complete len:366 (-),score=80.11 TRINITY_DN14896_c0_g1_i2:79-1038(-)
MCIRDSSIPSRGIQAVWGCGSEVFGSVEAAVQGCAAMAEAQGSGSTFRLQAHPSSLSKELVEQLPHSIELNPKEFTSVLTLAQLPASLLRPLGVEHDSRGGFVVGVHPASLNWSTSEVRKAATAKASVGAPCLKLQEALARYSFQGQGAVLNTLDVSSGGRGLSRKMCLDELCSPDSQLCLVDKTQPPSTEHRVHRVVDLAARPSGVAWHILVIDLDGDSTDPVQLIAQLLQQESLAEGAVLVIQSKMPPRAHRAASDTHRAGRVRMTSTQTRQEVDRMCTGTLDGMQELGIGNLQELWLFSDGECERTIVGTYQGSKL